MALYHGVVTLLLTGAHFAVTDFLSNVPPRKWTDVDPEGGPVESIFTERIVFPPALFRQGTC